MYTEARHMLFSCSHYGVGTIHVPDSFMRLEIEAMFEDMAKCICPGCMKTQVGPLMTPEEYDSFIEELDEDR
jgi:hypothetical protein